jgi:fibronectin-binding autotransporter adhesin
VLNGNQNHVNHFTVSQGKLIINGTVQDDDEIITVAGGATLGGTGSLSRAMSVSNGGILSPGFNGVGTLTFTGGRAITLNATSVLEMELGRPATSDRINASAAGNVTLNGTMNITAAEGFGLSQDGWIPVITYNTATDNGIVLGTTPPKYADMIISNFVSEGAVKVWVRPPPQGTIIRLR